MKKILKVVFATFLAVCLFGLTACGEVKATGEVKGNYKELDSETFNKIVEEMSYDNFFGSTENFEIGAEFGAELNVNLKSVNSANKEEKDAVDLTSKITGKFSLKDEGEKNAVGAFLNVDSGFKISADFMKLTSNNNFNKELNCKEKGEVYINNSGVYLDYTTEGIVDLLEVYLTKEDYNEMKDIVTGGKYSIITDEISEDFNKIDFKTEIESIYASAKEMFAKEKPTAEEFASFVGELKTNGFDLRVDFNKGLKVKLSSNEKLENLINGKIGSVAKFKNVKIEVYVSLDKNYMIEEFAVNLGLDVEAVGLKGSVSLKANAELGKISIKFPDFKDYENVYEKINGLNK